MCAHDVHFPQWIRRVQVSTISHNILNTGTLVVYSRVNAMAAVVLAMEGDKASVAISPDLNLTPLAAFLRKKQQEVAMARPVSPGIFQPQAQTGYIDQQIGDVKCCRISSLKIVQCWSRCFLITLWRPLLNQTPVPTQWFFSYQHLRSIPECFHLSTSCTQNVMVVLIL